MTIPKIPDVKISADNALMQAILKNHPHVTGIAHYGEAKAIIYDNGIVDITARDAHHHFQRILADDKGYVGGSNIAYGNDKALADQVVKAAFAANEVEGNCDSLGAVRDIMRQSKPSQTR